VKIAQIVAPKVIPEKLVIVVNGDSIGPKSKSMVCCTKEPYYMGNGLN
jgi:hypothetical protein